MSNKTIIIGGGMAGLSCAMRLLEARQDFHLLAAMHWEKAMYTQGAAYLEQQYGDDIYVAGDHNGLGMEPTAISGIFAANQILGNKA